MESASAQKEAAEKGRMCMCVCDRCGIGLINSCVACILRRTLFTQVSSNGQTVCEGGSRSKEAMAEQYSTAHAVRCIDAIFFD